MNNIETLIQYLSLSAGNEHKDVDNAGSVQPALKQKELNPKLLKLFLSLDTNSAKKP